MDNSIFAKVRWSRNRFTSLHILFERFWHPQKHLKPYESNQHIFWIPWNNFLRFTIGSALVVWVSDYYGIKPKKKCGGNYYGKTHLLRHYRDLHSMLSGSIHRLRRLKKNSWWISIHFLPRIILCLVLSVIWIHEKKKLLRNKNAGGNRENLVESAWKKRMTW